jgi:protein required for attachment to host cells
MSAITWVLAADSSRARVFETRGLKLDLQQVEDLRNPHARSTNSIADTSDAFARSVAELLERSRVQQRFDRLRFAVEPKFLVLLRQHISRETWKLVYEERDDDDAPDARARIERR